MARPAKDSDGIRKNLRLTEATERRIQRIRVNGDLASDSEVIRVVMREYVKIMDLQIGGAQFFYRMPGSDLEVPIDAFYETEKAAEYA